MIIYGAESSVRQPYIQVINRRGHKTVYSITDADDPNWPLSLNNPNINSTNYVRNFLQNMGRYRMYNFLLYCKLPYYTVNTYSMYINNVVVWNSISLLYRLGIMMLLTVSHQMYCVMIGLFNSHTILDLRVKF